MFYYLYSEAPFWVNKYPIDEDYYIGIGHCSKVSDEYMSVARSAAVDEISSQLEIKVSGNFVRQLTQENLQLKEAINKRIDISTKSKINDLELVDKFEDKQNYWVYYRLSKAKYQEQKKIDLSNAINTALSHYYNAKNSENNLLIPDALKSYFNAMIPLISYIYEPLEVDIEGNKVNLFNEIYSSILNLRKNLIININPQQIDVVIYKQLQNKINIDFSYMGKSIPDIPFSAEFTKGSGDFVTQKDNELNKQILILSHINSAVNPQIITIEINLKKLLVDFKDEPFISEIIALIENPSQDLLINVKNILLSLNISESLFGVNSPQTNGEHIFIENITPAGFSITDNLDMADYIIKLKTKTRKGNTFKSFFFAYSNTHIDIINPQNNQIFSSIDVSDAKGSAGKYTTAAQKSLNKAMENAASDLINFFQNQTIENGK